ncbi:LytR/AlgR family response regulator transcription factor [Salegentibacter chungangensis]|uniref:LytR/AlgR family response regulator transcription factor n=1 Tax=Salegentibacter chungangensis TaxID=1335724 RepID=A0ABW3NPJ0_9FLAO
MNLSCVIIDDEPLAVNVVKNYVAQVKGLELKNSFNNAVDSLEYLQEHPADLLFLDIDMPVIDGYSFLKSLNYKPMVIVTTAHTEYAVKGYELEILDYLVKPIPFPRFLKAVNKAIKNHKESEKSAPPKDPADHIFVKINKKKMKKICLNEILVIESLKDYIKIITTSENFIVHQTLSSFTEGLPENDFLRIHRSYTISLDKVETVEGNSLEIAGKRYTIGRSYLNEAKEVILKTMV